MQATSWTKVSSLIRTKSYDPLPCPLDQSFSRNFSVEVQFVFKTIMNFPSAVECQKSRDTLNVCLHFSFSDPSVQRHIKSNPCKVVGSAFLASVSLHRTHSNLPNKVAGQNKQTERKHVHCQAHTGLFLGWIKWEMVL